MCSQAEDYRVWLDPLTPKIAANLGNGFHDVQYEMSVPENSLYLSSMVFLKIFTNVADGKKKRVTNIVVKKPPPMESLREMVMSDEQFHNEILFYKTYGKEFPGVPRFIYAEEKAPGDSVIVLENVIAQKGYEMCQQKYDVPMEYTMAAFREIARFHAKAYTLKEQSREQFFKFVNSLKEARYCSRNTIVHTFNGTATRPIEYLRKQGYDVGVCDKLEAKLNDTYGNLIMKMVEPEEPFATLCHGDFTINNMLFKRKDNKLETMFIDFALLRYGSPILDLSTFLCLQCATEINADMLERVLKVYHDVLIENLAENGVDYKNYTLEALREDFKKKGLFGFFISTFFLGVQMGKSEPSYDDNVGLDVEKWVLTLRQAGGDEVSEILANMLLKLKDFGCLDHLL